MSGQAVSAPCQTCNATQVRARVAVPDDALDHCNPYRFSLSCNVTRDTTAEKLTLAEIA
jgi:hypothetical protein